MVSYCFDTSAWLEYFNAGTYGPKIRELIEGGRFVITPAVVAAELVEAGRRRTANSKTLMDFLVANSDFAPLTAEIARMAGKINAARSTGHDAWGMTESIILATARTHGARLVTRDPIYQDFESVDVLGAG